VFDEQREDFLQTWSGADSFMYKPFDLDDLIDRVKTMLMKSEPGVARTNLGPMSEGLR
jgi:DNA-binding response OmpR family regulator